jgi:hypothetical protein
MLAELKSLKAVYFLWVVLTFLAVIGPGFLILFQFKPQIVASYDIVKLLVFASALTMPLLFINALIIVFVNPRAEAPEVETTFAGTLAGTAVSLYLATLGCYLLHLRFWQFILLVTAFELAFGLVARRSQSE